METNYERPSMDVVEFDDIDIICASVPGDDPVPFPVG